MNVLDFISLDQLDELPEDGNQAFADLVRIASRNFTNGTANLNDNDEGDWRRLQDARYGFVNVLIAAAKRFDVKPFSTMEVPTLDGFGERDYRQFRADLDHFLTQLLIDNSVRSKRDSVEIESPVREKIRDYINALKQCIDKAELTDVKRGSLRSKLAEFEKELDKKRLSIVAVANMAVVILGVPGALWASYEITQKLVTNIMESVAEAKVADDDRRKLPPTQGPIALLPPRAPEVHNSKPNSKGFGSKLDGEIPF
jgi:hypothetical protein